MRHCCEALLWSWCEVCRQTSGADGEARKQTGLCLHIGTGSSAAKWRVVLTPLSSHRLGVRWRGQGDGVPGTKMNDRREGLSSSAREIPGGNCPTRPFWRILVQKLLLCSSSSVSKVLCLPHLSLMIDYLWVRQGVSSPPFYRKRNCFYGLYTMCQAQPKALLNVLACAVFTLAPRGALV